MRFLILSLFIVNFVHSKELFEPYSIRKSASISKPFILKNGWLEKKYSYPFTNLAKVDQFLSIERIYCADITALNGKEIGRTGFLKNRMINTYNRQRLYFISVELIRDQNLLEITAACPSNQLRHGPTSTSFKFIPVTNVQHTLFKENLGLFAVIFISIAFAVVFFEFYRYFPDLKESLSNAVLSLNFAAFQFFTSGYVYLFSDNDFLLKKIEYFFLFSLPPLFMISLLQSYKLKKNKIGTLVFSVFILFIIAIISVSNFPDLNIVLRVWHLHLPFLFILMLVVHTIAISTKDNLANYTITGSIFLFSFLWWSFSE